MLTRGQRMCQPLEISGVNASHREIIRQLYQCLTSNLLNGGGWADVSGVVIIHRFRDGRKKYSRSGRPTSKDFGG
ncbi:hypothetical protein JTE90_004211 [Oedothorax gibbosus]|uniref:Uncharacterized protein n=1 Tax=Oedothorax gibbosus TaxID=931172 RepID=A0AAV6V3V2_9ARAC|nr:hypothetical protein JTE90_004211 [Oedothorax gibbosus]